jgi:transcriptional regulator with XRE-family HTH domain
VKLFIANNTIDEFPSLLHTLGGNVRTARKAMNLTQMELAEESTLHRTYIADIERGARNVSIMNVARIARALGITISDLCRGIEGPAS